MAKTTGITVEEAQANLNRKREQYHQGSQEASPAMFTKTVADEILQRVNLIKPQRCFKHQNEEPCEQCRIEREEEERRKEDHAKASRDAAIKERMDHPEYILQLIGVGRRHLACSFGAYEGGNKTKAVCKEFLHTPFDFVLCGNPGTGKTHLAVAVIRELVRSGKATEGNTRFVTAPELLAEIRASYGKAGDEDRTEEAIVDKYADVDYLVLDDLGAEKTTDWSIATLYLIIDRRYREMKPTIVTTNLPLEQVSKCLCPRIASRLSGARVIVMATPDYRKKRSA